MVRIFGSFTFCLGPIITPLAASMSEFVRILWNKSGRIYREMGLKGKIGAVIDVVPMYPHDPSGKDVIGAQIQMERQCGWWLDPIFFGKYPELILRECPTYLEAMPKGYEEEMQREFAPVDMIGINYYFPLRNGRENTQKELVLLSKAYRIECG